MMSARCPAQRPASSPTCAARRGAHRATPRLTHSNNTALSGARVAATPRARRAARAFASPAASLPPAFAPHAGAAVPFDALRAPQQLVAQLGEGLETPVQLLYLAALLALLAAGSYLVVRQVLVRRELENAAKELGERVRSGDASAADHFEMGCVLLRKKVYGAAVKNLECVLLSGIRSHLFPDFLTSPFPKVCAGPVGRILLRRGGQGAGAQRAGVRAVFAGAGGEGGGRGARARAVQGRGGPAAGLRDRVEQHGRGAGGAQALRRGAFVLQVRAAVRARQRDGHRAVKGAGHTAGPHGGNVFGMKNVGDITNGRCLAGLLRCHRRRTRVAPVRVSRDHVVIHLSFFCLDATLLSDTDASRMQRVIVFLH